MRDILQAAVDEIRSIGLTPRIHDDVNAVSAVHGSGGVLFNGHLDTVPVGGGWEHDLGERTGDRLWGRGTADMKAGCVAALAAARDLLRDGVPFSLLFTTDEETTMKAAMTLKDAPFVREAAAVVVGEPSDLDVITAEKGVAWFRATTRGRSAHGSMPHLGVNAIHAMVGFLARLEPHARPWDPTAEVTVNVGTIAGGTKVNVVADACTVDLDTRYPGGEDADSVRGLLEREIGAADVAVELELVHNVPVAEVAEDAPHVRKAVEIAGTGTRRVTYATEMAWYHETNPRTLVLGPGKPELCHAANEYVDLPQVVACADVYRRYAAAMAPRG